MTRSYVFGLLLIVTLMFACGACATKKNMNKGFERVDGNMQDLENSVEGNQSRIDGNERVIRDHDGRIIALSEETRAALSRIERVENIAMGKLLYQVTLDSDAIKFELGKAQLDDSGKQELDEMVDKLVQENRNVFIEIQGHTDSSGSEEYNYNLGSKRAESVRLYLSEKGIPLHRMSLISYGETKPLEDNSSLEGRKKNRRVVLLVLE